MVGALALVAVCTFTSWQGRSRLEAYSEATAVGDKAYYEFSDPKNIPATIVVFRGQPLTMNAWHHEHTGDSKMLRVGKDDSGAYSIYVPREATGEKEAKSEYFLKTGENEYLGLKPRS